MSLSSHLIELQKKHQALSDTIESMQQSPAACSLEIKGLKKKKLQIKEEIQRLGAQVVAGDKTVRPAGDEDDVDIAQPELHLVHSDQASSGDEASQAGSSGPVPFESQRLVVNQ